MSTEINLSEIPVAKILGFLEREVGPRSYWLHNRIGGTGWSVDINNGRIQVTIDDDKMATFLILKLKH